jgi:hypothetical protein
MREFNEKMSINKERQKEEEETLNKLKEQAYLHDQDDIVTVGKTDAQRPESTEKLEEKVK